MATVTASLRDRPVPAARSLALVAGAVGAGLIGLSVAVPWLTVFRGLQPLSGFSLEGGPLAGVAVVTLGLLAVGTTIGGGRVLRALALLGGIAIVVDAVVLQMRIAAYTADPGPAALLTQPSTGFGAGLMAIGGALILVPILVLPLRRRRLDTATVARVVMSVALVAAGWIHLLLVPEHLAESTVLGLGFLAAGVAQVLLAGLVLWWPRSWTLGMVVAINVTLIAIYAYGVLVGLPFGAPGEHAEASGLVVGAGEPIDWYGAVSKVAELASAAIAFMLLTPTQSQDDGVDR